MATQDLSTKKSNFINNCVAFSGSFLSAYASLRQLRQEYTALGYTFVQADIPTAAAQLTPAMVVSLMSTFDQIDALINSNATGLVGSTGYLTNLNNMKS